VYAIQILFILGIIIAIVVLIVIGLYLLLTPGIFESIGVFQFVGKKHNKQTNK